MSVGHACSEVSSNFLVPTIGSASRISVYTSAGAVMFEVRVSHPVSDTVQWMQNFLPHCTNMRNNCDAVKSRSVVLI